MEVKINKEIRDYTEHMFFGLTLRQLLFSMLAILAAVFFYFLLKDSLGTETVSWVCILAAFPFAAMGFIRYNGMTAEKFIVTWIRSEILMPKTLTFRSENIYYALFIKAGRKQNRKKTVPEKGEKKQYEDNTGA